MGSLNIPFPPSFHVHAVRSENRKSMVWWSISCSVLVQFICRRRLTSATRGWRRDAELRRKSSHWWGFRWSSVALFRFWLDNVSETWVCVLHRITWNPSTICMRTGSSSVSLPLFLLLFLWVAIDIWTFCLYLWIQNKQCNLCHSSKSSNKLR